MTNIRDFDDGEYDDTALRREDEADAYKQAKLRELEKQLDAQLEAIRLSKDARTLREWAADELVKKFEISALLAGEIAAAEVLEWAIARIPFEWNRPVKKATRFMRLQAIFSAEAQYHKQEGK